MATDGSVLVRRALTPEDHARIRWQLALIPVYVWFVYGWMNLFTSLPHIEPVRDFMHFYIQGVVAREGNRDALYDIDALAAIVPRVVPGAPATARYPPAYGPQMSLFFWPLASLSYLPALGVWLVLSLAVYLLCCAALWRICPHLHDRPCTTMWLVVAAPALHFDLGFTQVSVIGLVFVTAGFFALKANRPFLAGLALGSLVYKPPLGVALAFVFLFAGEWQIIGGAIIAAAAQYAAGVLYWGFSILGPYARAMLRLPSLAASMEPHNYQMHSWRTFFDLTGLPGGVALTAYGIVSILTVVVALVCWRARAPLVHRYSALLIATMLVDPHLYAYDLLLLTPVFLLLWDWVIGEPDRRLGAVFPGIPLGSFRDESFRLWFQRLLYFCYFSSLFGSAAVYTRIQVSVVGFGVLFSALSTIAVRQSKTLSPHFDV